MRTAIPRPLRLHLASGPQRWPPLPPPPPPPPPRKSLGFAGNLMLRWAPRSQGHFATHFIWPSPLLFVLGSGCCWICFRSLFPEARLALPTSSLNSPPPPPQATEANSQWLKLARIEVQKFHHRTMNAQTIGRPAPPLPLRR